MRLCFLAPKNSAVPLRRVSSPLISFCVTQKCELWYIINEKRTTAHKVGWPTDMEETPPVYWPKFGGRFSFAQ